MGYDKFMTEALGKYTVSAGSSEGKERDLPVLAHLRSAWNQVRTPYQPPGLDSIANSTTDMSNAHQD